MAASFRAELLVLRKWPAIWVLTLLGPFLTFFFGYFLPYFDYLSAATGPGGSHDLVLTSVLPEQVLTNAVSGFGFYGSAIATVLGALVAGGEWGRGTLKTALTQRPSRLETYTGQSLALAVVLVASVLATLAVGVVCSLIIASVVSEASSWPAVTEFVKGIGAASLVSATYASFGLALGVLFRSAGLAIGAGLVWTLAVQGLVEAVALQAGGVLEAVYNTLPGTNTITVTGVFGTLGRGSGAAALPTSPEVAPWILTAYAVAFLALGALLLRHRDVS